MKKLTPLKAIRKKCLDCVCGSANEVKLCPSDDCPLFTYRFGKNPARRGIGGKGKQFVKKA
jgi:hypothetical protein